MKNHSIKAVCLVVFFILVIVFSGSCGGGGGGEEGGGDVNQPQLQGQVNLPISVPLQKIMVIAGLEQVGVSGDGIFSITANRDVTQVLMITDGENLLGMQTIPDTSNPTQVNITARTTAETLIFLAPFIAQGTVEENPSDRRFGKNRWRPTPCNRCRTGAFLFFCGWRGEGRRMRGPQSHFHASAQIHFAEFIRKHHIFGA